MTQSNGSRQSMGYYIELNSKNRLEGLFDSTLTAFAKLGQIDRELLSYTSRAIELAFALLPNEEIAFQIALDAALNVRRFANVKHNYRRYYTTSRKTKVLLSRAQVFQQLILSESQKWERYQEVDYLIQYLSRCDPETSNEYQTTHNIHEQELAQELVLSEIECNPRLRRLIKPLEDLGFDERDMVIRYLESLIRDSMNGNSSHVVLVVSHMIYSYTLPQVTAICSFLNADAIGAQYLYTLRSKVMLRIKERFGPFLITQTILRLHRHFITLH